MPPNIPAFRQPVLFISHGGGPWPYIPEMRDAFAITARALADLPKSLPEKPKAILMISAHWEEDEFTVSTSAKPPMIYDYGGFPEHTYRVQYPAPGSVPIAQRVRELLSQAGIRNLENPTRGFDHGTFVPLSLMYPEADVPVVSMSVKSNYSPVDHIRMGEALQSLRDEGVLIVGSGLSYHNMRGFRQGSGGGPVSEQFGEWIATSINEADPKKRELALVDWEKAPVARQAHPQEDHLLPMMAISGAAGHDPGTPVFVDHVWGIAMASYRFG